VQGHARRQDLAALKTSRPSGSPPKPLPGLALPEKALVSCMAAETSDRLARSLLGGRFVPKDSRFNEA
jgi:hypothetical protein